MNERNYWVSWIDDEGERRECGRLTLERADKLAQETCGWIDSFDPQGRQIMIVSYYR